MAHRIHKYTGEKIDVSYDAGRCIHAAECISRLHAVFDNSKRPWVQPDAGLADGVAATILHCPSGALHYERKDGGAVEPTPIENTIRLDEDGPLYVRGDVTVVNGAGEVVVHDTRLALCRCGASENKPFCDNSHISIGFSAPGTVAEPVMTVAPTKGGKLRIETTTNGSLHLIGNFTLVNDEGETVFQSVDEWLCRCGGSGNKPFCDGSHNRNGFVAS
ncbi:MAG: CDGSH iron-sulfur domain-containing protein [Chloroflexi bacterium]|nr:CDGSH iron-sulfur domain-containing protein [Chloroflexota bacterium]MCC6897300.1 CDGSH iron-sulfur domain-containing protein [Anaerolineae bacterium]